MIPYGKQEITEADIESVVKILRADFITQGPKVPEFETAIALHCQSSHAIAASSATACLHLACEALGVNKGDRVWTSPISFVASANCALYCNAMVDFVDVNTDTGLMDENQLAKKLKLASQNGTLPKVVIPVHLGGQSCNMKAIALLAKQYDFAVIEDASHSIGAYQYDKPVGSCQYSDITVFSFHPVKIITTGEGGVATTNNQNLANKMKRLRSHGVTREPEALTELPHGPWYYQQLELGFNYRLTDLQAALGLSQLTRLTSIILKRNELANRYSQALETMPYEHLTQLSDCYSSYHLYIIRVPSSWHSALFHELRNNGIGVNLHYIPIPSQPFYKRLGFSEKDYPNAMEYYHSAISLPLYPTLTIAEQDRVIQCISNFANVITTTKNAIDSGDTIT